MRAARISVSTRRFGLTDIAIPTPRNGQVRIRVKAAGLCLSDVHFLEGTLSPGYLVDDAVTLGHEVAGEIELIGAKVQGWNLGDRVIVCAGMRDEKNRVTTLGFDYDGGFAEFIVVDQELLLSIPDSLPFEQACIIPDAVSTPWAAISQTAKVSAGEAVAVFGVGGLGIHAVQLLKMIGASPVIAIDPLLQARNRALLVGADISLDPSDSEFGSQLKDATKDVGLNAAFDFAGSVTVRTQALRALAEGGRLVIVGLSNEPIMIPNDIAFAYMRTQILGHYGSEPHHTHELVSFIEQGRLDLSASITEILPLEDIEIAFERLKRKIGNPIRIVIKP